MTNRKLAVQLWTVRNEIQQDLPDTLSKIKYIGYDGVELWFPGSDWPQAERVRDLLAQNNLEVAGAHVLFADLRDRSERVFDWHRIVGNRNLTIPHIPQKLRESPDDWRERVEEIALIAQRCLNAGFVCSYHNHDVEFVDRIGEEEIQDYIYRSISSEILKAQIDTYFVKRVGKDPVHYLRKYADRMISIHLKDQSTEASVATAPVGQGTIDWGAVLAAADETSAQWYVVEDNCDERDALQSIATSYEFLRARV